MGLALTYILKALHAFKHHFMSKNLNKDVYVACVNEKLNDHFYGGNKHKPVACLGKCCSRYMVKKCPFRYNLKLGICGFQHMQERTEQT